MLLGYSDSELANMGGYDLVHYDDLAYVASAHQECKYLYPSIMVNGIFFSKSKLILFFVSISIKNWSIRNDSLQTANQRWTMAMATNQF